MTDLNIVDDVDASYLDIDDILMSEEKICCLAKYDLLNLDFRRHQEGNFSGCGILPCFLIAYKAPFFSFNFCFAFFIPFKKKKI
jgi:hypothetical protein